MSISTELEKLRLTKTAIRKALQRKNTGLTLKEIYPNYYTYIASMSDDRNPDEDNLKDYVEDRLSFLEIIVNKIRPYAFRNYSCLQGLYLNNSKVVTLDNINAFYGISPIIFVPSNLVDQYKTATNWSLIADRIQKYSEQTIQEMYLLQHIDKVQTVSWIQQKTIKEIIKDFR